MTMEIDLRARLLADGPVSAVVGRGVTWDERPQGSDLPSITLQVVSDPRSQSHDGFETLRPTTVQVDIWGSTRAAVRTLTELAIAAVVPAATIGCTSFERSFVDTSRDSSERVDGGATIFRTSLDLVVWHQPA